MVRELSFQRQESPSTGTIQWGTRYFVVNGLRALASECRVDFSTGQRVPSQDSALEFLFPSAQGPDCLRYFPREFRTGRPTEYQQLPDSLFEQSASRVIEHRNDPVRNPLLRYFGTCYPVVNGLRVLESECRVEFSTEQRVPSQDSALEFEFPSAHGRDCRRYFPREFRTGRPTAPELQPTWVSQCSGVLSECPEYIDVAYDTVPYAANVSTRSQEPKWFENSASSAKSHRALNQAPTADAIFPASSELGAQ
ncbi:hypothetical protein Bbelb_429750 [Branchiostoma belcheri]|nr:hypothetical protein Bbelb_429750 [Branchiostoma belcheri]